MRRFTHIDPRTKFIIDKYKFKESSNWRNISIKYNKLVEDFTELVNNYIPFITEKMILENDIYDDKYIKFSLSKKVSENIKYNDIKYDLSSFIELISNTYSINSIDFFNLNWGVYSATLDEIINDKYEGPNDLIGIDIVIPFLY